MAENPEQVEEVQENAPTIEEKEPVEAAPAPKKRGRPPGSRDTAPRKPRVRIVEEPPTPPPEPPPAPEPPAPKRTPKPKVAPREATQAPREVAQAPQREVAPEMSPRTMFRVASQHIATLQTERENARRQYWQDTISRSLR